MSVSPPAPPVPAVCGVVWCGGPVSVSPPAPPVPAAGGAEARRAAAASGEGGAGGGGAGAGGVRDDGGVQQHAEGLQVICGLITYQKHGSLTELIIRYLTITYIYIYIYSNKT